MRFLFVLLMGAAAFAEQPPRIVLPQPQTDGGKPLMQVLKERKSHREFSTEKLSPQVLSNLLWAAFGINRADSGGRTAPSASNRQEIDIYVATVEGLYLYAAKEQVLLTVVAEDVRTATATQAFARDAPVQLVYVADFAKMAARSLEDRILYSAADTGYISQNVYLYCASEGLATVARASVDRPALTGIMKLRPEQRIILAQSVGYPKKPGGQPVPSVK